MLVTWLLDAAAVAVSLAVLAIALTAIGLAIRHALGSAEIDADECFVSFWVGFAAVTWLLILWNFFLPVRLPALFTVLVISAICFASLIRPIVAGLRAGHLRPRAGEAAVVLITAVWVVNQCLNPFESWDGVLYHLQGVAWAKAYAAVPGIANLHGPLAFNNSSFLYDALIDTGFWERRGFHLASGVLVLVSILQGVTAALKWRRSGGRDGRNRLLAILLLAVPLYYVPEMTNNSTDLPMALVLCAAFIQAHRVLERRDETPVDRSTVITIGLLLAVAIAIKLSAAIFATGILAVLVWKSGGRTMRSKKAWGWAVVVWLAVLGPWAVRGIVLSGYPFFPVPYFGVPVDWRAPLEHARVEQAYIGFTERGFSWHFVGSGWPRISFGREASAVVIPAVLAALGLVQWRRARRDRTEAKAHAAWSLLIPGALAAAVWAITAPSHRYAPILFWTCAAVALSEWFWLVAQDSPQHGTAVIRRAIVTLGAAALLPPILMMATDRPGAGLAFLKTTLVGSADRGLRELPTDFPTEPYTTDSGLVLNVPLARPNGPNRPAACGTAPLPCTANPAPNLELRRAGSLQSGFRVRGEWKMRDWPYPWQPMYLPEWRRRHAR